MEKANIAFLCDGQLILHINYQSELGIGSVVKYSLPVKKLFNF